MATVAFGTLLPARRLTGHLHADTNVTRIAFSEDGRLVATASLDHTARVWDVQTGDSRHAGTAARCGSRVGRLQP